MHDRIVPTFPIHEILRGAFADGVREKTQCRAKGQQERCKEAEGPGGQVCAHPTREAAGMRWPAATRQTLGARSPLRPSPLSPQASTPRNEHASNNDSQAKAARAAKSWAEEHEPREQVCHTSSAPRPTRSRSPSAACAGHTPICLRQRQVGGHFAQAPQYPCKQPESGCSGALAGTLRASHTNALFELHWPRVWQTLLDAGFYEPLLLWAESIARNVHSVCTPWRYDAHVIAFDQHGGAETATTRASDFVIASRFFAMSAAPITPTAAQPTCNSAAGVCRHLHFSSLL